MKKTLIVMAALLAVLALPACGSGGAGNKARAAGGTSVSELMDTAAGAGADAVLPAETAQPASPVLTEVSGVDVSSPDADVDLTLLSSTMIYSEVSQMMYSPEEFIGKTVKMEGMFFAQEGQERNYYSCIIQDATACCANGIEFRWSGEHEYPADYPAEGAWITVTGTFQLYEENGYYYCELADAVLQF